MYCTLPFCYHYSWSWSRRSLVLLVRTQNSSKTGIFLLKSSFFSMPIGTSVCANRNKRRCIYHRHRMKTELYYRTELTEWYYHYPRHGRPPEPGLTLTLSDLNLIPLCSPLSSFLIRCERAMQGIAGCGSMHRRATRSV